MFGLKQRLRNRIRWLSNLHIILLEILLPFSLLYYVKLLVVRNLFVDVYDKLQFKVLVLVWYDHDCSGLANMMLFRASSIVALTWMQSQTDWCREWREVIVINASQVVLFLEGKTHFVTYLCQLNYFLNKSLLWLVSRNQRRGRIMRQ